MDQEEQTGTVVEGGHSQYAAPEQCPPQNEPAQWSTVDYEIERVKFFRKEGDTLIQSVRTLPGSRERALAITKLQEAVMWLGMDLKRIGEENPGKVENPYPNSKDPSNTKIDPTAQGLKL